MPSFVIAGYVWQIWGRGTKSPPTPSCAATKKPILNRVNRENFTKPTQMQLSKKQQDLLNSLLYFLNLDQILNVFRKKITLIYYVLPKLETAKEEASWMSKKFRFRTSFNNQHAKRFQSLQKSPAKNFYHTISWLTGKFNCNMSLLVISKILGLFVNILTADDKYSLRNSKNLRQPITMQLFKKQIFFLNFCCISEISIKLETALKIDKPFS